MSPNALAGTRNGLCSAVSQLVTEQWCVYVAVVVSPSHDREGSRWDALCTACENMDSTRWVVQDVVAE